MDLMNMTFDCCGDFITGELSDLLMMDNDTVGLIKWICLKGLIK